MGAGALKCWVGCVAVLVMFGAACAPQNSQPPSDEVCASPPERPAALIVAGSGSNLALARALVDAYGQSEPTLDAWVPQSIGTQGAIRAVRDGVVDVGLASRELRDDERQGLRVIPLARSRMVLGAHPSVSPRNLTREMLVALYEGKVERWSERGQAVVPLLREQGDSGNRVLAQELPELFDAMHQAQDSGRGVVVRTDQKMRDALLHLPGAFGFIDEGIIRLEELNLTVIPVEGITPPSQSRLIKELFVLVRPDASESAKRFVRFARSPAAEEVFRRGGYLRVQP